MEEKRIKATLLSFTKDPEKVLFECFMNMHNQVPDSLDKIKLSDKEFEEFLGMLMEQPHQTVLEFVNTVWLIENGSRAFQTELVRTRQAAYSIQSLRIVDVGSFADEKRYYKSSVIKSNPEAERVFDETMEYLQNKYKALIAMGCAVQDARGILPLNIHSPITMTINLRSLYHTSELRFCGNAAEEYRELMEQMKKEIATKMHPLFAKPMQPMCIKTQSCPSPFPCNKYPQFKKSFAKIDVSKWLKG